MTYWMHFFPADPQGAKPDRPRLRDGLIHRGFILEPRGDGIDPSTLSELWHAVREAAGLPQPDEMHIGSTRDLVAAFAAAGLHFEGLAVETLTVPDLVTALVAQGHVPARFVFAAAEERYRVGPLYHALCDVPDSRSGWTDVHAFWEDYGDEIMIKAGEGLLDPPGLPDGERVAEDGLSFLSQWIDDPKSRWTDPETGSAYDLLDLDWENTLGVGKCFLTLYRPGYLDGGKVAALLADLAGLPFRWSRVHI